MRAVALFVSLVLAPVALIAQASQPSASQGTWKADLERRRAELVSRNGAGSNSGLRDQLVSLGARDEDAHGVARGEPKNREHLERAANLPEIDQALTSDLKAIVDAHGWPTIALVGLEASNAAMLVLTHTPDHAWQRTLLPRLEALADEGEIDGAPLALVVDKELLSEGKLQRYGTQFRHVGNAMALVGVEDPANLDRTRARLLLPPMDVYQQQLIRIYHMPVSRQIVSPGAPAE